MPTTNFKDQIPDYFAGTLSPVEHKAFEKAMQEDTALTEAIAIWQDLEEVLAPAPEDELLNNIARLRADAVPAPQIKPRRWAWGIPILLLIGVMGWYFWPREVTTTTVEEIIFPEATDSSEAPFDTLEMVPKDSIQAESISRPPVPPFRRPTPALPEEEKREELAPVFAANYDPNPLIEAEMTEQLRGEEVSIELTEPAPEATVLATNGIMPIAIAGEITTDYRQDELTIRLLLLSNAVEDYQQSNYLITLPAELMPTENGFALIIKGSVAAKPGLYYYFIEWEEEETYLKIGKFRVK